MEKTVNCSKCNEEMKECPQCKGFGCRWCNGHGMLHVKSSNCNGTGNVKPRVEVNI